MIFYDEWIPIGTADEARLPRHPGERFEKIVVPDLNVRRRCCSLGSAEKDVFSRGFEKIIDDFVGAHRQIARCPRNGLRISARNFGSAMEVTEERIYDRHIGSAAQIESTPRIILGCAMHPDTVEDDMVGSHGAVRAGQCD